MIQLSELNMKNFDSTIRIKKSDYFNLPTDMRYCQEGTGAMVLVSRGGRQIWMPAEILE